MFDDLIGNSNNMDVLTQDLPGTTMSSDLDSLEFPGLTTDIVQEDIYYDSGFPLLPSDHLVMDQPVFDYSSNDPINNESFFSPNFSTSKPSNSIQVQRDFLLSCPSISDEQHPVYTETKEVKIPIKIIGYQRNYRKWGQLTLERMNILEAQKVQQNSCCFNFLD